ncbi:armadillo-type protein, partial [Daldinia decipiens]|uniref:armadillo-type protein n=1 Tax=Daldinia decipiens TaxID=326647 RepID=UPI0020C2D890
NRLGIWEPRRSNRFSVADLFQPKKDTKKENQPNYQRVLIRGQAGMGKSTLCKKIVYDYIYHNMWSTIINRIIWLRLRQLKGQNMQKYNLNRSLYERYFDDGSQEGRLLARALYSEVIKEESTTLFILDGLDGVLGEISSGESELLLTLLRAPRVIITTRPYAADRAILKNIDREVETIGFYTDQVDQYIKTVAPGSIDEIKAFLSTRPRIEELARIPIQLDAFCYSFEKGIFDEFDSPQTMTELYNTIEKMMWKKDVVQLEKNRQGRPGAISKNVAMRLNFKEIRGLVQAEVNVLQALAFDGFNNNTEEFDSKYMDKFWDREDILTEHLAKATYSMSPKDLDELSLLRTSDGGSAARNSSYHFLHLTLQEYFAAQYFVQHWPDKQLPQLGVSNDEFLRREKYNPRFNTMWRFVTGLLHAKGDARKFFEIIETEPYDLLGSAHRRLVVYCLDKVVKLQNAADFELRKNLEDYSKQWLSFELRLGKRNGDYWKFEFEYPENILQQCLSETDDELFQCIILWKLEMRPILSLDTVDQVVKCCESSDREVKIEALKVLSSHRDVIPSNCFHTITNLVGDSDRDIRLHAGLVLYAPSNLPDVIFSELIALAKQGDEDIRTTVFDVLTSFSTLPEKTLLEVVAIVPDLRNDGNIGYIMSILGNQLDLPEEITLKMLDSIQQRCRLKKPLKTPWGDLTWVRPWIASKQSGRIAPKIVEKLLNMLKDPNSNLRKAVAYAFHGYKLKDDPEILPKIMDLFQEPSLSDGAGHVLYRDRDLPENILHQIVDCLENYDTDIQSTAADILRSQVDKLPTAIIERIGSSLNNQRNRHNATKALLGRHSLPEQISQTVFDQFKDQRTRVKEQEYVLRIHWTRSTLPESILQELLALLQVEDEKLRSMAQGVFLTWSPVSKIAIRKIAILLDDKNINVQYTATRILYRQPSLPREVLRKMISIWHYSELDIGDIITGMNDELMPQFVMMPEFLLDITIRLMNHPSRHIRLDIAIHLSKIKDLPEGVLKEAVHLLGVENEEMLNNESKLIFGRTPGSSDDILKEAVHLLNHPNEYIRDSVASIFASRKAIMSEEVLHSLAPQLKGYNSGVLESLIRHLGSQPILPEMMLQDLVTMLSHPEERTRNVAAEILTDSLDQSDLTFNSLFDLLDEESFVSLFKFWMEYSLQTQITRCVDGKSSVIDLLENDRRIPLDKFKNAVRKARESLGVPYKDFGQVL